MPLLPALCSPIVRQPALGRHTGSVILLHGLVQWASAFGQAHEALCCVAAARRQQRMDHTGGVVFVILVLDAARHQQPLVCTASG